VPATAGAEIRVTADGAVTETPVEMGPAELAAVIGGSAIVRTSTAIDAAASRTNRSFTPQHFRSLLVS